MQRAGPPEKKDKVRFLLTFDLLAKIGMVTSTFLKQSPSDTAAIDKPGTIPLFVIFYIFESRRLKEITKT